MHVDDAIAGGAQGAVGDLLANLVGLRGEGVTLGAQHLDLLLQHGHLAELGGRLRQGRPSGGQLRLGLAQRRILLELRAARMVPTLPGDGALAELRIGAGKVRAGEVRLVRCHRP